MASCIVGKKFFDVEIRIFQKQDEGYPVEITLDEQQEFPRGYLASDILPWVPGVDPQADGQKLFQTLFADDPLREAWAKAQGQAPQRRIRLRIDPTAAELHALPWELLHKETMLSAHAATPFSRYLPIALPWGGPVEECPIRVLAVISDPDDIEEKYGLPPTDVALERKTIEAALKDAGSAVEVDFLEPPVTSERLEEKLRENYHVLHYTGHGAFSEQPGKAVLYVQQEDGKTRLLYDHELANMLDRQGVQPRLVFLSACQSAIRPLTGSGRSPAGDAFLGMAPKLVSVGVPAVIAMQDRVTVDSALKFSASFYERLLVHGQVDLAVNEARSTLLTVKRRDAAVPVLFMRLESGQLWESKAEKFPLLSEPMCPPDVTDFVGRKRELAYFTNKLETSHLAVITGLTGVGKTQLAAMLAQQATDSKQVCWHTFHKDEGVDVIIGPAGVQSGDRLSSIGKRTDELCQMIGGRGYLLCFDNFQVVEDDPLLARLVEQLCQEARRGKLSLVITSRRIPEFVPDAEFEPLTGLSIDDTKHLLAVGEVSMGNDLATSLHDCTGGNAQLLTMAIVLLRYTDTPRSQITAYLAGDVNRLLGKIWRSLNEDMQEVMKAVSVLLGYPGTCAAIEAILDSRSALLALGDLIVRRLLTKEIDKQGKEHYRQHSTVQKFCYALLKQKEQREMHSRAGKYYDTVERDTLKAARHFFEATEYKYAARLATDDVWALITRGQARPLRCLLERFDKKHQHSNITPLQKLDDTIQQAAVTITLGQVYPVLGEMELATKRFKDGLKLLENVPDDSLTVRELHARAYRGWGGVLLKLEPPEKALGKLRCGLEEVEGSGSIEEAKLHIRIGTVQLQVEGPKPALESFQKGLELLPDKASWWRFTAHLGAGNIYLHKRDIESSNEHYYEALEICDKLNYQWERAGIRLGLARGADIVGKWDESITEYRKALRLIKDNVHLQTRIELALGIVYTKQGNDELAETHLKSCIKTASEHEPKLYELIVAGQSSLADLYLRQSKVDEDKASEDRVNEVASLLERAREQALQIARGQLPEIYRGLAKIQLANRKYQVALDHAKRAVGEAHKMSLGKGESLRILAQARFASGEREKAIADFEESHRLLNGKDPYETACTEMEWGLALLDEGEEDEGRNLLGKAQATFEELGAKRDLKAVTKALHISDEGGTQ